MPIFSITRRDLVLVDGGEATIILVEARASSKPHASAARAASGA